MAPAGLGTYDPDRAYDGYTLCCESYDDPSESGGSGGEIHLLDMEGRSVHQWQVETALQSFCELLPNGNLLYPTRDRSNLANAGVRELDPESNVVWSYHCRIDHDFQVLDDDRFLFHTISDYLAPNIGPELTRHPYLIEVDRAKDVHWEWRGDEHYEELGEHLSPSAWKYVQDRIATDYAFDWAHNNTAQVIPENEAYDPDGGELARRVEPGNIVFSYRSVDVIGTIDYPSGEIVWAWGPDEIDGQHLPHVIENGNVLLFDNGTRRVWSRVVELDPLTEEVVWEYTSEPKEDFFSPFISGARRLPNGNTLICEGAKTHLFEVTPEGETVWSFTSPFSNHDSRGTIYRCQRYDLEYVQPLLDRI